MKKIIILFGLLFSLPLHAEESLWDLNVEYGRTMVDNPEGSMFRVGTGIITAEGNLSKSINLVLDKTSYGPRMVGAQAEISSLRYGTWAQTGLMFDSSLNRKATVTLGWIMVGMELQVLQDNSLAYFGKARLPLGLMRLWWGNK
jgi:hypothetical protein